jgi:hypothetical protein
MPAATAVLKTAQAEQQSPQPFRAPTRGLLLLVALFRGGLLDGSSSTCTADRYGAVVHDYLAR